MRMDRKKFAASGFVIAVTIAVSIWMGLAGISVVRNVSAQSKARRGTELGGLTVPALAISPDGKLIVSVLKSGDTQQLHVQSVEARESKPIPGTEGAGTPFFSPDGK